MLFGLARPAFVLGGVDPLGIDATGQAQQVVGQFVCGSLGPVQEAALRQQNQRGQQCVIDQHSDVQG